MTERERAAAERAEHLAAALATVERELAYVLARLDDGQRVGSLAAARCQAAETLRYVREVTR